MNVVNLTALAEARAKMTSGAYALQKGDEAFRILARGRTARIATMEDDYNKDSDGPGIVATHNAADVLIEVARAALTLRSVERSLDGHGYDNEPTAEQVATFHTAIRDARHAYDAALAKVTL